MSTVEERLARLEAATFTPEQLAEATAADVLSFGEHFTLLWPMLTPAEKLKIEKVQPGITAEAER